MAGFFLLRGNSDIQKGILDPLNVDKLWKGCHCVGEVSSENFAKVTREAAGASKSIQLRRNVHKGTFAQLDALFEPDLLPPKARPSARLALLVSANDPAL